MLKTIGRTNVIHDHEPAIDPKISTSISGKKGIRRQTVGTVFTKETLREDGRLEDLSGFGVEDIKDNVISSGQPLDDHVVPGEVGFLLEVDQATGMFRPKRLAAEDFRNRIVLESGMPETSVLWRCGNCQGADERES